MAWSAPVCVEIYENQYVGFENLGLEFAIVNMGYFAICFLSAHHAKKLERTGYKHIDAYLYLRSERSWFKDASDKG